MSHPFDDQDEEFRAFLRNHRPVPPAAAPHLEERLLQAVDATPLPLMRRRRYLSKLSSGIAAGLLLTWTGYGLLISSSPDASLEAFLEANWNEVLASNAETDSAWSLLALDRSK